MKKILLASALFVAFMGNTKAQAIPQDINALLQKHTCYTCHAANKKMVGPSWTDIAAKKYTSKQIIELVYKPKPSNWPGYPAMAALPQVPKADLQKIAAWIGTLAKK